MYWDLFVIIAGSLVLIIVFFVKNYLPKQKLKLKFSRPSSDDSFGLILDTIKIDGFRWQESVPVDIYDNELDPKNFSRLKNPKFTIYEPKNKFYKQKGVTNYSSVVYISIPYNNKIYSYSCSLPIELTKLRLKFYKQKRTRVYVEKIKENNVVIGYIFSLDFLFLETEGVSVISTGVLKVI